MAEPHEEQFNARRFLLGDLDEQTRQLAEERLTDDPEYLELVLEAESELMEDYIARQLSEDERDRFEKYVLTDQGQVDQLHLTRALSAFAQVQASSNSPPVVVRTKPVRPPARQRLNFLLGAIWNFKLQLAVIVLIIACGSVVFVRWRKQPADTNNPQLLKNLLVKLNTEQNLKADGINHGFIIGPLKGGLVRDEQETRPFRIPEKESLVQLRLALGGGNYQTFRATIETVDGAAEIPTLDELKAKSITGERVVIVYLPANILAAGDYQLRLSGVEQDQQLKYLGLYTFRIVGK
jgi:hypothetical protein